MLNRKKNGESLVGQNERLQLSDEPCGYCKRFNSLAKYALKKKALEKWVDSVFKCDLCEGDINSIIDDFLKYS